MPLKNMNRSQYTSFFLEEVFDLFFLSGALGVITVFAATFLNIYCGYQMRKRKNVPKRETQEPEKV